MTAVSRSLLRHSGQIFHIMTKHGRIFSDVPTTDPDSKKIKQRIFRSTFGVFNGKGVNVLRKM